MKKGRVFSKLLSIYLSSVISFMYPLAILAMEVPGTNNTSPALVQTMISAIPDSFTFTQDLSLGSQGDQVKMLQIILNTDSRTRVNDTGLGSPGNETTYFGYATLGAVRNFQEIYASVILEPIGYDNPTGTVASRTRTVLNQVLANLKSGRSADLNISIGPDIFIRQFDTVATSTNTTNTNIPQITTSSVLPDATYGLFYSTLIYGNGGDTSYTWDIASGTLPTNLQVVDSGVRCFASPCYYPMAITGTPTSVGTSTFTARVNSGGQIQTKNFSIKVNYASTTQQTSTTSQTIPTQTRAPLTAADVNTNFGTMNQTNKPVNSSSGSNSTALIAAGAIVGGAALVSALSSSASSVGPRTVFGGYITFVQYCTCEASILLFIFDKDLKSVIQLLYIPGVSTLKSQYNVFSPGPTVLGGYYQSGVPCLVYDGESCESWGTPTGIIDTLRGVGTTAT